MSATFPGQKPRILTAILVGGFVAGSLDLTLAFISFGSRMPQGIAAGLVGRQTAFTGGAATWILGVLLHYTIAFGAAAIYCLSSLRLSFLKQHFIVCGLFFGIAIHLVMNLVILPISAMHAMGPYQYRGLTEGLLVHMFLIGLPIAFSLNRFSK
jgi:hypothetical protein